MHTQQICQPHSLVMLTISPFNYKAMKQIITDNAELLEVLTANGINIICNDNMEMMITDADAIRIDAIVAEKAPAAFADYVIR